ncbi:hypothetical protein [Actinomadura rugatobispora]|uniref:DUF4286 family protein n=1 Tax=Actinomadura rugatobispora TaxID=1994 RepID=A0ABW1ACS4_9ACTN|nr:hypothetical protein GCM10010200_108730 [Actinomadura rugatobispora]
MPKGIMVVQSGPSDPAREDEYNEWYGKTHLADVCAVPGFVGARRYKVRDGGGEGGAGPSYLAIYEIEADDLAAPLAELRARSISGQIKMSDALQMDPAPVVTFYELIE